VTFYEDDMLSFCPSSPNRLWLQHCSLMSSLSRNLKLLDKKKIVVCLTDGISFELKDIFFDNHRALVAAKIKLLYKCNNLFLKGKKNT
jgi:hypothetical protein